MAPLPPSQRNTPAANADILGDDATLDIGPDPAAEQDHSSSESPERQRAASDEGGERAAGAKETAAESGEARAGKDINQAGFVKDPGGGRP